MLSTAVSRLIRQPGDRFQMTRRSFDWSTVQDTLKLVGWRSVAAGGDPALGNQVLRRTDAKTAEGRME
jgi:hypothetical protein